ncbi:MAG: hypothetical protein ACI92Z_000616 [Paracoccaceae bacterium]|jgi:hypothetical protein
MPDFNFDEDIDRRQVPALKGHKMVLGADGMDLFARLSPTWIFTRHLRCLRH